MIHQYKKVALLSVSLLVLLVCSKVSAFDARETAAYFNGPTIGIVTDTTAEVSLSPAVVSRLTDEEKAGLYFEYSETNQVCFAIYPVPESCLPKKVDVGKASVVLANLKPNTSYTVNYKHDNTIRCITTPCPSNDFKSLETVFVTKTLSGTGTAPLITRNLTLKSSGKEVLNLQNYLIKEGYLSALATGYYGKLTYSAVKEFQKVHGLTQAGVVGPLTRNYFLKLLQGEGGEQSGESFEGKVTTYSTACYADGVCSITVDGKEVVTTVGRLQKPVGEVRGIPDLGELQYYIGARAKVYAKKTAGGYTLYGDKKYYVEILPKSVSKLPSGSVPSGDLSLLPKVIWSWQKTVSSDGDTVVPKKEGSFTVSFTGERDMKGTTDCNNFHGVYRLTSEGLISFTYFSSTKKFCDDSQELVFQRFFVEGGKVVVTDVNTMRIVSGEGSVMYFTKEDLSKFRDKTSSMDTKINEIKRGETVQFNDLKMTNNSGGHKILAAEGGGRGGDMSFAELFFETPRKAREEVKVMSSPEKNQTPFVFDGYLIRTNEVGWNGDPVTLEVSKLLEGDAFFLKKGETKVTGNMTVTNQSTGILGAQKSSAILEFVSSESNVIDVFEEGKSVAFAGSAIHVKKINKETGEVELTIVSKAY